MAHRPASAALFASAARWLAAAAVAVSAAGCSTTSLVLTAAGIATDTSMTWEIAKHVHAKLVENDPTPCLLLNSVQRAVSPRCEYAPGSIRAADVARSGLQDCPLALAVRDRRLWNAVPDLVRAGAKPEHCAGGSPLDGLARLDACPDFASASPDVIDAFSTLALYDPRALRHDVVRMLSCPSARRAGLDAVLVEWLARGSLAPGNVSFSPLSALHPDLLVSSFGRDLEAAGHTPRAALDGFQGVHASGFEEALRTSHWEALDWWLARQPKLASLAPPQQGGALGWVPLQRVLMPGWLRRPETQRDAVARLLAAGADPRQKLPTDRGQTVLSYATAVKSPHVVLLDPASGAARPIPRVAQADAQLPAGN